jgi:hypothetical protein
MRDLLGEETQSFCGVGMRPIPEGYCSMAASSSINRDRWEREELFSCDSGGSISSYYSSRRCELRCLLVVTLWEGLKESSLKVDYYFMGSEVRGRFLLIIPIIVSKLLQKVDYCQVQNFLEILKSNRIDNKIINQKR